MAAYEKLALTLVAAFYAYVTAGTLFALLFVTVGVKRVDEQAKGTGWGFRLLIFPGCVAFWALLLSRWVSGRAEPPQERNPHR
jgi:hypothetical protein